MAATRPSCCRTRTRSRHSSRSALRTASASRVTRPTSPTRCRATTTGRPSAASPGTTRRSACSGRSRSRSSPIATAQTHASRRSPTSSPGEVSVLEIARRGWDALNRKDLDAVLAHIHPDVEWRPAQGPGGMEGNVYRGREAYERWLREELPEVWEEFRGEDLDF